MNVFKIYFLTTLLFFPQGLYAMHCNELVRLKENIVKNNFKDTQQTPLELRINQQCITSQSEFDKVNEDFQRVINHFHYELDLKYFYAKFLVRGAPVGDVIDALSQFFLQADPGMITEGEAREFLAFSYVRIKQQSISLSEEFKKYRDEIDRYLKDPSLTYKKKKELLLPSVKSLFRFIEGQYDNKYFDPHYYDALLKITTRLFDLYDVGGMVPSLVRQLLEKNPAQSTPFLKEYQAYCLAQECQFEKAISLYESMLGDDLDPDNFNQTSINYERLACWYLSKAKIKARENAEGIWDFWFSTEDGHLKTERAVSLIQEKALPLAERPRLSLFMNLFYGQLWLHQYDQALVSLNKVKRFPPKDREDYNITQHHLKRDHRLLLQMAGKTDELTKIMRSRQEKKLTRNKKIAALIKAAQEQHQKERELVHSQKQQSEVALQKEKKSKINQHSMDDAMNSRAWELLEREQQKKEQSMPQSIKKQKKKTRGTPNPPVALPHPEAQPVQMSSLIHINALTSNKHAWETFDSLFAKYRPDVLSDSHVKISLHEIDGLLTALGQDFDASKGKGSHKKATLDFHSLEIDTAEQMVILTNKIYLKPEQIKALRDGFLAARIVPDDAQIIARLREEARL